MKIFIVAFAIMLLGVACNSGGKVGDKADSTTQVPGNSAGALTTTTDTAKMDTSFGRIMTDSAR